MHEFDTLKDSSKIWIYQAPRRLSQIDKDYITSELTKFVDGWESHGSKVQASFNIVHDLFVIIGADESETMASGCSIDKSVHIIQAIGQHLDIDFFNRTNVAYLKGGTVVIEKLKEFKNLIKTGVISGNTIIFNNTITQKYELAHNWKMEAQNSWLNPFFQHGVKI